MGVRADRRSGSSRRRPGRQRSARG